MQKTAIKLSLLVILALILSLVALPQEKKSSAPAQSDGKTAKKEELIDINSCSRDQLKALEGIGDAYADKIIAGRPYKVKTELISKSILPKDIYGKISNKVIAKQPKAVPK